MHEMRHRSILACAGAHMRVSWPHSRPLSYPGFRVTRTLQHTLENAQLVGADKSLHTIACAQFFQCTL
jgi:hypothetical protein